jgi:hypothetical protein
MDGEHRDFLSLRFTPPPPRILKYTQRIILQYNLMSAIDNLALGWQMDHKDGREASYFQGERRRREN